MADDFNHIPFIKQQLRELNKIHVIAGVFSSTDGGNGVNLQVLALANEFGTTIRPKHGQWLTIPSENVPANLRATQIPGLFRPKGKNILCVKDESSSSGFKVMFYLVKQVVIPERSFLRETVHTAGPDKWVAVTKRGLNAIFSGKGTAGELATAVGEQMVTDIRHTIMAKMEPENAAATIARKGRNDPLFDTGRLYNSIDYRVVSEYG